MQQTISIELGVVGGEAGALLSELMFSNRMAPAFDVDDRALIVDVSTGRMHFQSVKLTLSRPLAGQSYLRPLLAPDRRPRQALR